jgi:serine protease Do
MTAAVLALFSRPEALQASAFSPKDCGGHLVNHGGQVVGVNIARAGRTESYAIPASEALSVLYDLMSGKLAPARAESP